MPGKGKCAERLQNLGWLVRERLAKKDSIRTGLCRIGRISITQGLKEEMPGKMAEARTIREN